jgi:hypothetical protein
MLQALAVLLLVAGCGGECCITDDLGKSPEEVEVQAKTMDSARLQEVIDEYKGLIAEKQKEATELARELAGSLTDLATGAAAELEQKSQTLGKEMLRVGNRYTPLGNLWQANAAVDRLIYNTLHQLPGVDPGFYERRANIDQKLLNERGQRHFWDSTSSLLNP